MSSPSPRDHPRLRGEHAGTTETVDVWDGSSPLTRGTRLLVQPGQRRLRIIPAYAGNTSSSPVWSSWQADHPRLRGEHYSGFGQTVTTEGSSPLTRGTLADGVEPTRKVRIIPAYAGNTVGETLRRTGWKDHPRLRGEHFDPITAKRWPPGSSPLTRGTRAGGHDQSRRAGIIPAYAGNTTPGRRHPSMLADHPRLRGEHLLTGPRSPRWTGSSPLTRGTLQGRPVTRPRPRIIPAYAGNTCWGFRSSGRSQDHPRLRGEHEARSDQWNADDGSSPLTRGTPRP